MNVSPPPFKPEIEDSGPSVDTPRDLTELAGERIRDRCVTEHRKLQELFDTLQASTAPWQKGERERTSKAIWSHLTKRYLPAINELREATTPDELQQLSRTLAERLSTGMELEPTEKRDDLWERLLIEKCIVMDAAGPRVLKTHLSRLEALERVW